MSDKKRWCEPCFFIKSEKVKAVVLCEDCSERYCKQCALDHAKFRVFRHHQVSQLLAEGDYIDMDFFASGQVSVGQQGTEDSQTTSWNGHAYRKEYKEEVDISSNDKPYENCKDRKQQTQVDNTNLCEEGLSNDEYLHVTESKTATRGETVPPLMVTSGSHGGAPFEEKEGLSARMMALPEEKQPQKLRIWVEETERERNDGGRDQAEIRSDTEQAVSQKESISFKVKVTETDLIKRIPGIHKKDIARSVFLFMVETREISLFLQNEKVLTCPFHTIRRYGIERERVHIEVGRISEFGEGKLWLISDQSKEIYSALHGTINQRAKTQKGCKFTKPTKY